MMPDHLLVENAERLLHKSVGNRSGGVDSDDSGGRHNPIMNPVYHVVHPVVQGEPPPHSVITAREHNVIRMFFKRVF